MRVYALYILTAGLCLFAFRRWFVGACGLLVLNLLIEHPDFPKEALGINGLNPWNILFLCVLTAWYMQRVNEPPSAGMSRGAKLVVGGYFLVLTVACVHTLINFNMPAYRGDTMASFIIDFYLNPCKILILAYLIYDGARTPQRQALALGCIVVSSLGLALLVLKYRLATGLTGDFMRGRQRLGKEVGLHANQIGWLMAGTFWGMLALAGLWRRRLMRFMTVAASMGPLLAVLVVQSRAGYLALAAVGVVFGVARWRKLLIVMPAAVLFVAFLVPAVRERALMGVEEMGTPTGETAYDMDTISAGRTTRIWPPMIRQIKQSPLIGYGRLAILRTPARKQIEKNMGLCPSHPHNAFIELMADVGGAGTLVALIFYFGFFATAVRLFRVRWSPLATAVGGVALALLTARFVTGISGCSFFPTRSMFGLFAAGGLALRVGAQYRQQATAPMVTLAHQTAVRRAFQREPRTA